MQLEGNPSDTQGVVLGAITNSPAISCTPEKGEKTFDFSKSSRRKIALKFCYSGWEYSGLAFQLGPTPLPTVENVLFDAMAKAHLVDPSGGFDGCGWERCGRTDRGVSAAGQVVSVWVRGAAQPKGDKTKESSKSGALLNDANQLDDEFRPFTVEPTNSNTSMPAKKPVQELDYLAMLNRLLPDTIRVIAWSPVSEAFSARFSCKYRHYKYFFSSLHLDVSLMEAGASRLLGEHDFRNLCKLDVQKQITSFRRKILRASVTPLGSEDEGSGRMYVFDLVGTAFLYHQVRHIMAALFLVGSGLEPPETITELMNVEEGTELLREEDVGKKYAIVGSKPDYQMADGLPLMLWDSGYDESELDWRTSSRLGPNDSDIVRGDLYHQIQGIYTRSRVYSVLDQHFMKAIEKHHPPPPLLLPMKNRTQELQAISQKPARERVITVPLGGGTFKRLQKYKPLLERTRLDTVEVMNERWRLGKGKRREDKRKAGAAEVEPTNADE